MTDAFAAVLSTAQTLVRSEHPDGPITREAIASAVDRVLALNKAWTDSVDRQRVITELETRLDIWIGREQVLENNTDHVPWLLAARRQDWRYWARYRQYMLAELAPLALEGLDQTTNRILGLLEDPARDGPWDRRGLVAGHVQSGKTANYTALICKAADAGYKLIIVLAGVHKNLRSQTQMRLDEGFLGYETMPPTEARTRDPRPIGVGHIDGSLRPNYVTNRSDNGDFSRAVANNMGINPGGPPLLFVVKKNVPVLRNLLSWVEWVRPTARDVPLLVIDDEADHASVDTREQVFDEEGRPDPDHNPTETNKAIRRLLHLFDKSAYVGYTATPYANIFIHERGSTPEHGEDLFPRSFIVNLPAPSNYAGPARIFGLESDERGQPLDPLPLTRHITDHADTLSPEERSGWVPPRHRNGHNPLYAGTDSLPPSLREAIGAFVICCAARRARGQINKHNSMLVHVTRFTSVQGMVKRQVEAELTSMRRRLRRGDGAAPARLLDELKSLWDRDFVPTTVAVRSAMADSALTEVAWREVERHLADAADDIHVREINGSAGDILDYETHQETGFNVIAIGGDKLARGLTLYGLSVSYFLRASRMYDTLMQMGRWFGYRPGYLDLCRLYTTADLHDWFEHITEANEELRQEFDHMVAVGGTPRDYGLRVRSHPILMVTSQVKMRHGTTLQLSFDSDTAETVVFHRDALVLARNAAAAERLVRSLGTPSENGAVERSRTGGAHRWEQTYLWANATHESVLTFLRSYSTHPAALRINNLLLAEYIERQVARGELRSWTIALFGNGEGATYTLGGFPLRMTKRGFNERSRSAEEQKREGVFIIRRLLSPRDPAIDLDLQAYEAALEATKGSWQPDRGRSGSRQPPQYPSARDIASKRTAERGVLLLYPVDPAGGEVDDAAAVMGFGISFPKSPTAEKISYEVNNVYWAQEYETEP